MNCEKYGSATDTLQIFIFTMLIHKLCRMIKHAVKLKLNTRGQKKEKGEKH